MNDMPAAVTLGQVLATLGVLAVAGGLLAATVFLVKGGVEPTRRFSSSSRRAR